MATTTVPEIDAKERFLTAFAQLENIPEAMGPDWLADLRRKALQHFEELGIPGPKVEDWRFTSLKKFKEHAFVPAPPSDKLEGFEAVVRRNTWSELTGSRIIFVNGQYQPSLSNIDTLPEGVKVLTLNEAIEQHPEILQRRLAHYADYDRHPFTALNTAFMQNGVFIDIPDGRVIEDPIHILYITNSDAATPDHPVMTSPRTLVLAGRAAQATLIESYIGPGKDVYFNNGVTEIAVEEDAHVDHYKLQRESLNAYHVQTLQVHQERSSNFRTHTITLGGGLSRNEINIVLDGEGIESTLNGLYLISGAQHTDTHTRLDHAKPHCHSVELYKGILDDKASGVFTGKILVRQDAQKTDAIQSNRGLLLSDSATLNSQPQLEIYADDVKCTHGATIGQLDTDATFYLRSRGLSADAARDLLTFAFASEIAEHIRVPALRNELENFIAHKFRGMGIPEAS